MRAPVTATSGDAVKTWIGKPLNPVEGVVKATAFTVSVPEGFDKGGDDRSVQWRHGAIDADGPSVEIFSEVLPHKTPAEALSDDRIQLKEATGKEVEGAWVITSAPPRASVRVHRRSGGKELSCWASYVTDGALGDRTAVVAWLEKICLTIHSK